MRTQLESKLYLFKKYYYQKFLKTKKRKVLLNAVTVTCFQKPKRQTVNKFAFLALIIDYFILCVGGCSFHAQSPRAQIQYSGSGCRSAFSRMSLIAPSPSVFPYPTVSDPKDRSRHLGLLYNLPGRKYG